MQTYKTRRGKRWAIRQSYFAKHLRSQAADAQNRRLMQAIMAGQSGRATAKATLAKTAPIAARGRIAAAAGMLSAMVGRALGRRGK